MNDDVSQRKAWAYLENKNSENGPYRSRTFDFPNVNYSLHFFSFLFQTTKYNEVSMSRIYNTLIKNGYSYFSYSIMRECWEEAPSKRPTFQWLCSTMKRLLDDQKTYVNLEIYDSKNYVNFDMMMDKE